MIKTITVNFEDGQFSLPEQEISDELRNEIQVRLNPPKLTPSGLFHTPADMNELQTYVENLPDDVKFSAAIVLGMTWNLACKLTGE